MLRIVERTCVALRDGSPADASPLLYLAASAPSPRAEVTPLLVLVEPLEPANDNAALAGWVIRELRCAAQQATPADLPQHLAAAFDLLNQHLCAENARRAGLARRRCLGVTCAMLAGDDLVVAQAPPGQLLVRQGAHLHLVPALAGLDAQPAEEAAHDPLGLRSDARPRLLRTRLAPDDLVAGLSSSVAGRLADAEPALRDARSADALLSGLGAACDRAMLRDGVLAALRLGPARRALPLPLPDGLRRGLSLAATRRAAL